MPIKRTELVNNEFYHIVKRGINKNKIFIDEQDRFRFINSLLAFNDENPVDWQVRRYWHNKRDPHFLSRAPLKNISQKPIVKIYAFVLMKNHFHILLSQIKDNGIIDYMRKLGGYTYYFNKKYDRTGTLFEGRYRAVLIKSDLQLKNTFTYIHTNPVEILEKKWKGWEVEDARRAISFLETEYSWSSYWDYLNKDNFPLVIDKDFFNKLFGDSSGIREEVNGWILSKDKNFNNLVPEYLRK